MGQVVAMTLPLFALIGIGFLAVRSRYLAAADLAGVSALVMRVFLPAMIFLAIAGRPLAQSMPPGFVAAYRKPAGASSILPRNSSTTRVRSSRRESTS